VIGLFLFLAEQGYSDVIDRGFLAGVNFPCWEIFGCQAGNFVLVGNSRMTITVSKIAPNGGLTAASVWNKLPQDIRSATSLPVFRRQLKTHFFRLRLTHVK